MSISDLDFPVCLYRTEADLERATEQVDAKRKEKALQNLFADVDYFSACVDGHDSDRSDLENTVHEIIRAVTMRPRTVHTLDMVKRALDSYLDELARAEVERLAWDEPVLQDELPF